MNNIKILDCTFRDGGHLLNWKFKKETVAKVIKEIHNSGINYFELGYRFNEKLYKHKDFGDLAFCTEEYLRDIKKQTDIENITIMMNVGQALKEDFISKKQSVIDTIRVATYADSIDLAIEHIEDLHEKGYELFLNLMALTHIPEKEFIKILKKIDKINTKIKAFYFADSFGSMYPDTIKKVIKIIKDNSAVGIGYHGHNNLQMAFANALTAIECGAKYIDSSLYGQGRGAGNLPTEIICAYLNSDSNKRFDMNKIISVIENTFIGCTGKVKWGYSIDTLLTGINDIHPTYIKALREMNISTTESYKMLEEMTKKRDIFSKYNEDALKEFIKTKR